MSEENQYHSFFPPEESPIPVPPADDAWSQMRQQLDRQMPVKGGKAVRFPRWFGGGVAVAAAAVLTVGVWKLSHSGGASHSGKMSGSRTAAATSAPGRVDSVGVVRDDAAGMGRRDSGVGGVAGNSGESGVGGRGQNGGVEGGKVDSVGVSRAGGVVNGAAGGETAGKRNIGQRRQGGSGLDGQLVTGNGREAGSGGTTAGKRRGRGGNEVMTNGEKVVTTGSAGNKRNGVRTNREKVENRGKTNAGNEGVVSSGRNAGNEGGAGNGRNSGNGMTAGGGGNGGRGGKAGGGENGGSREKVVGAGSGEKVGREVVSQSVAAVRIGRRGRVTDSLDALLPGGRIVVKGAVVKGGAGKGSAKTAKSKNTAAGKNGGMMLAVGIWDGQTLPVGQQQSYKYNSSQGNSTLADHVPGLYARLYMGDRMYVQAGVRFSSPQLTPRTTIDSVSGQVNVAGTISYSADTLTLVNKLYYTDIPVSFHYRVWKGLYLGAGVDYSRFSDAPATKAIAYDTTYPNRLGRSEVSASYDLKTIPHAYQQIRKSDWRVMLHADYVWRRLTVGVDYQFGLTPYSANGKYPAPHNNAFHINLSYDILRRRLTR